MKLFMRTWMERVLGVPKNKTLDCGCSVRKGGILAVWSSGYNTEHYGSLCVDHLQEYNAEIITGVDNGRN